MRTIRPFGRRSATRTTHGSQSIRDNPLTRAIRRIQTYAIRLTRTRQTTRSEIRPPHDSHGMA